MFEQMPVEGQAEQMEVDTLETVVITTEASLQKQDDEANAMQLEDAIKLENTDEQATNAVDLQLIPAPKELTPEETQRILEQRQEPRIELDIHSFVYYLIQGASLTDWDIGNAYGPPRFHDEAVVPVFRPPMLPVTNFMYDKAMFKDYEKWDEWGRLKEEFQDDVGDSCETIETAGSNSLFKLQDTHVGADSSDEEEIPAPKATLTAPDDSSSKTGAWSAEEDELLQTMAKENILQLELHQ
ncbi:hypothetical protein BC829DRAFT_200095 [Chytridium lagenaria]|nr:hypothetical protein BC829DRAFT_200095 [Chytridium lagenaria]